MYQMIEIFMQNQVFLINTNPKSKFIWSEGRKSLLTPNLNPILLMQNTSTLQSDSTILTQYTVLEPMIIGFCTNFLAYNTVVTTMLHYYN